MFSSTMAMLASSASRVRSDRRNRALTLLPSGHQRITVVALAANLGRFLDKYGYAHLDADNLRRTPRPVTWRPRHLRRGEPDPKDRRAIHPLDGTAGQD
jgi:hypothetical protein